MNTKQCNRCQEVKLLEAFRKSKQHRLGVQNICKECQNKAYHNGTGKFNDEAPLDWRDKDLEAKNRYQHWARHYGIDGAKVKARLL